MARPRTIIDPHGTYGRLTIIGEVKGTPYSRRVMCRCQCGEIVVRDLQKLFSGNTLSCGCLKRDRNRSSFTTHGLTNHRLYRVWRGMRGRCLNKNDLAYKNYGGRGITISKEWIDFDNFYDWALRNGYQQGFTIERINNDGNYEPNNCTWILRKNQSKNRRNLHWITLNGETKTISDWSRQAGINRRTLLDRINGGWPVEKALGLPAPTKL
jgi:hypothetical protein